MEEKTQGSPSRRSTLDSPQRRSLLGLPALEPPPPLLLLAPQSAEAAARVSQRMLLLRARRVMLRWREATLGGYLLRPRDFEALTQLTKKILMRTRAGARSDMQVTWIKRWLAAVENRKPKPQQVTLSGLPDALLSDLAQHLTMSLYDSEELIFLQTEAGSSFYIILSGQVDIYDVFLPKVEVSFQEAFQRYRFQSEMSGTMKTAVGSREHPSKQLGAQVLKSTYLSSLLPGTYFGEIALISDTALRTASAVAVRPTVLITIPKMLFSRTLKSHFSFTLEFEGKRQFLRELSLFASWDSNQINNLAYWMESETAPKGAVLLRWNVKGDRLLLLRRGMARVMGLDGAGRPVELSMGSRGALFGEGSLLEEEARREFFLEAHTAVEYLVLPEASLRKFLRFSKRLWQERREFYVKRLKEVASLYNDPASGDEATEGDFESSFGDSEAGAASPRGGGANQTHRSTPLMQMLNMPHLVRSPLSASEDADSDGLEGAPLQAGVRRSPAHSDRSQRIPMAGRAIALSRPPQGRFWSGGDHEQIFRRRPLALAGATLMLSPIHAGHGATLGARAEPPSGGGEPINDILSSLNKFCTMKQEAAIWSPSKLRLSRH